MSNVSLSLFIFFQSQMNIFSFCLNSYVHGKNSINHQLIQEFSLKYGNAIQFTPLQQNTTLNILLSGQAMNTRGELLRNNPVKVITEKEKKIVNLLTLFSLYCILSHQISMLYFIRKLNRA